MSPAGILTTSTLVNMTTHFKKSRKSKEKGNNLGTKRKKKKYLNKHYQKANIKKCASSQ